MIVVKIEMWPHGDESHKRPLAEIAIANVGGDHEHGDYYWAISHQFESKFAQTYKGAHALLEGVGAWKQGRVTKFLRSRGAVRLLKSVLREAFGA